MQLTVVLALLALSLSSLDALPWSPSDPMQPSLYTLRSRQKQRNLAKVQLPPQHSISFIGPRQATDDYEDEEQDALEVFYNGYFADDYSSENLPGDSLEREEDEDEEDEEDWR